MIVFKCSSSKQKEENLLIVNFTNGGGIQDKKGDPQSIFKPKKKKRDRTNTQCNNIYIVHIPVRMRIQWIHIHLIHL